MKFEIKTREDALAVLAQLQQMKEAPRPEFYSSEFLTQTNFIKSKAHRIAAQCTRRAGKSKGSGLKQLKACYMYPGSRQLYLGLTRSSAKSAYWNNVLKELDREHQLGASYHETDLVMTLPNGSSIKLAGADSTREEMEKLLGGKYPSIIIDEAGSFRQDLRKLVYENLEPCVIDYNGWIGLIGTPTDLTTGLFFDVTNGKENGWEIHKWSAHDNPFMAENFQKQIDKLVSSNPRVVETPWFRRMYMNEWVVDLDNLVYKADRTRNYLDELPENSKHEWTTILSVDLGYNDATAFVVGSYRPHDKNLYLHHSWKKPKMIVSEVAERINYYREAYKPDIIVVDPASKQVVQELIQRYDLPLISADKTEKVKFIEMMNSDFILGRIKLVGEDSEELANEYASLIWDEKAQRRVEHPNCDNHCADAALYLWRKSLQYQASPEPHLMSEQEKIEAWFEREAMEMEARKRKPFWEQEI